jgi:hypothetical protein
MMPPPNFVWKEPWHPIDDPAVASSLFVELEKETCPMHPIYQRATKALAQRFDCDDALFSTNDADRPLAVVHLTWKGSVESDPIWPVTEFFDSWDDWVDRYCEA